MPPASLASDEYEEESEEAMEERALSVGSARPFCNLRSTSGSPSPSSGINEGRSRSPRLLRSQEPPPAKPPKSLLAQSAKPPRSLAATSLLAQPRPPPAKPRQSLLRGQQLPPAKPHQSLLLRGQQRPPAKPPQSLLAKPTKRHRSVQHISISQSTAGSSDGVMVKELTPFRVQFTLRQQKSIVTTKPADKRTMRQLITRSSLVLPLSFSVLHDGDCVALDDGVKRYAGGSYEGLFKGVITTEAEEIEGLLHIDIIDDCGLSESDLKELTRSCNRRSIVTDCEQPCSLPFSMPPLTVEEQGDIDKVKAALSKRGSKTTVFSDHCGIVLTGEQISRITSNGPLNCDIMEYYAVLLNR